MKTNLLLKLALSSLCFAMTFQSIAQENLTMRPISGDIKAQHQQTFVIKHKGNQTLPIVGEYGQLCIAGEDSVMPIQVRFQIVTGFIIVCRRLVDEAEIEEDHDGTVAEKWIVTTSNNSMQLANFR